MKPAPPPGSTATRPTTPHPTPARSTCSVGQKEYNALGEQFEDKEHTLFGEDGFEKMVGEVVKSEQALAIGDLAKFTPKI